MSNLIEQDKINFMLLIRKICEFEKISYDSANAYSFYLIKEEEEFLKAMSKYGFEIDSEYEFFHKNNFGKANYNSYSVTLKIDYV